MPSPSAPTETRPSPTEPSEREGRPSRVLGLSGPQVAGSALAAASAAVAASWLGVAGTVVGAALGSLFGTVGSALYAHSLATGRDAVRRSVRTSRDGRSVTVDAGPRPGAALRADLRALPWRRLVLGATAALVVALAALTVAEQLTGRPISGYTADDGSSGTTVGRVLGGSAPREADQRGVRGTTRAPEPADAEPRGREDEADPAGAADPTGPTAPSPTPGDEEPGASRPAEPTTSPDPAEVTEPAGSTPPDASSTPGDPAPSP